ncbi:hypothetical protein AMTRI_Chr09g32000 [Amborella trichopoda]
MSIIWSSPSGHFVEGLICMDIVHLSSSDSENETEKGSPVQIRKLPAWSFTPDPKSRTEGSAESFQKLPIYKEVSADRYGSCKGNHQQRMEGQLLLHAGSPPLCQMNGQVKSYHPLRTGNEALDEKAYGERINPLVESHAQMVNSDNSMDHGQEPQLLMSRESISESFGGLRDDYPRIPFNMVPDNYLIPNDEAGNIFHSSRTIFQGTPALTSLEMPLSQQTSARSSPFYIQLTGVSNDTERPPFLMHDKSVSESNGGSKDDHPLEPYLIERDHQLVSPDQIWDISHNSKEVLKKTPVFATDDMPLPEQALKSSPFSIQSAGISNNTDSFEKNERGPQFFDYHNEPYHLKIGNNSHQNTPKRYDLHNDNDEAIKEMPLPHQTSKGSPPFSDPATSVTNVTECFVENETGPQHFNRLDEFHRPKFCIKSYQNFPRKNDLHIDDDEGNKEVSLPQRTTSMGPFFRRPTMVTSNIEPFMKDETGARFFGHHNEFYHPVVGDESDQNIHERDGMGIDNDKHIKDMPVSRQTSKKSPPFLFPPAVAANVPEPFSKDESEPQLFNNHSESDPPIVGNVLDQITHERDDLDCDNDKGIGETPLLHQTLKRRPRSFIWLTGETNVTEPFVKNETGPQLFDQHNKSIPSISGDVSDQNAHKTDGISIDNDEDIRHMASPHKTSERSPTFSTGATGVTDVLESFANGKKGPQLFYHHNESNPPIVGDRLDNNIRWRDGLDIDSEKDINVMHLPQKTFKQTLTFSRQPTGATNEAEPSVNHETGPLLFGFRSNSNSPRVGDKSNQKIYQNTNERDGLDIDIEEKNKDMPMPQHESKRSLPLSLQPSVVTKGTKRSVKNETGTKIFDHRSNSDLLIVGNRLDQNTHKRDDLHIDIDEDIKEITLPHHISKRSLPLSLPAVITNDKSDQDAHKRDYFHIVIDEDIKEMPLTLKRNLPSSLQPTVVMNGTKISGKSDAGPRLLDLHGGNKLDQTAHKRDRLHIDVDKDVSICESESNSTIFENASNSRRLPAYMMNSKSITAPQSAVIGDFRRIGTEEKPREDDERLIFQAALQDLAQPKLEANLPDGVLAVRLLLHQKIALAWMAFKETSSIHCSGGFLADDQGLGKTISVIALILYQKRPPAKTTGDELTLIKSEAFNLDEDDECVGLDKAKRQGQSDDLDIKPTVKEEVHSKCKGRPAAGTLVVCPSSILQQWAQELKDKVTDSARLSVLIYYGSSRTKDPFELANYDVVLTTYSIVSMEVPKQALDDDENDQRNGDHYGLHPSFSKKRKKPSNEGMKGQKDRKKGSSSCLERDISPLARVNWFRVVLDEAQTIKNHRTQVARACWGLRAKRRWCLSGTPMQNSVTDLFSYFRFLRYDPYAVYKSFCSMIRDKISKNANDGYKKLQAVLRTIMLRRTKGTLIDGRPIISLPPKIINLKKVDFSPEERDFYSTLEADSRSRFKDYAAAGTVNQNYANILLMLLRLRQACDHPLLVKGDRIKNVGKPSLEMARKLPRDKQINLLKCLEASSPLCGVCNDPPEDVVITTCGHVFCKQCVFEKLTGDDNLCPASACKCQLSADSIFSGATLRSCVSDHQLSGGNSTHSMAEYYEIQSEQNTTSSKINAALEILLSLQQVNSEDRSEACGETSIESTSEAIVECSSSSAFGETSLNIQRKRCNELYTVPSSQLARVPRDHHGRVPEKAIVFSQWTGMLDLLEIPLTNFSIQYRRLDGTMSLAARDRAVRDFNSLPEVTVMIMSLKAGNLGLNMVAACHVILLDLWWNPTTEDQAVDRAHRIGQTRPVTVSRLTVKDTVEDRILDLQEKKRKMVASAFGEDQTGSHATRLTVEDLRYLFMV